MSTIGEKLAYLEETKRQIKESIIAKGGEVSDTDTFRSYATKVTEIPTLAPNIFVQNTEPEIKEGIWIQGTGDIEKIVIEESLAGGEGWSTDTFAQFPASTTASCATVGTTIYMFGTASSSATKQAYKFDTLTKQYTTITDNYYSYGSTAVASGTDIYIFGSSNDTDAKTVRKYNTLTGTYTALTKLTSSFKNSTSAIIGNDVYLFGSTSEGGYSRAMKYNLTSQSLSGLNEIPIDFRYGRSATVGTDIYLFGGKGQANAVYKYDTLKYIYTKLNDAPFTFITSHSRNLITVGTDIYLFGEDSSSRAYTYKYDTLTNTFIRLADNPYSATGTVYSGKVENSSTGLTRIYCIGGMLVSGTAISVIYNISNKTFDDKAFVIVQAGSDYKTQLYTNEDVTGRLTNTFSDAFYNTTEGGNNYDLPAYYGNGSEWVQIR